MGVRKVIRVRAHVLITGHPGAVAVEYAGQTLHADAVEIHGPSTLRSGQGSAWIETEAAVSATSAGRTHAVP